MFCGFLSNRTFSGFARSYLRYCVRSYVRNIWDYHDKVARAKARAGRGYLGAAGYDPALESPKELIYRVTREVEASVVATGGTLEQARREAYEASCYGLRVLARDRGLPINFYVENYGASSVIDNDRGGLSALRVAGYGRAARDNTSSGAPFRTTPPAVKANGGLRGGASRR